MRYWTFFPVSERYSRIQLRRFAKGRSYNDLEFTRFVSYDRTDPRTELERELMFGLQKQLLANKPKVAVIFRVTELEQQALGSALQHGVLVRCEEGPRVFVYPLMVLPFISNMYLGYAGKNEREDERIRLWNQQVQVYVDGRRLDLAGLPQGCKECPDCIQQALGGCQLFHTGCTVEQFEGIPIHRVNPEWHQAHQPRWEALNELATFIEAKHLCNLGPFETVSLEKLQAEPVEPDESARSESACLAARTKRKRVQLCAHCTVKDGCGQRTTSCIGPVLTEDWERYGEPCQPWMVASLCLPELTKAQALRLSTRFEGRSPAPIYFNGPSKNKEVRLSRWTPRGGVVESCCLYAQVCQELEQPECQSWEQLSNTYFGGQPISAFLKTCAWLIYNNELSEVRSSGWGGHHNARIGLVLNKARQELQAEFTWNHHRSWSTVQSLVNFNVDNNRYRYPDRIVPADRCRENEQLKQLCGLCWNQPLETRRAFLQAPGSQELLVQHPEVHSYESPAAARAAYHAFNTAAKAFCKAKGIPCLTRTKAKMTPA